MPVRFRDDQLGNGQKRFLLSTAMQTLLAGGIGAGKTTALGLKLLVMKAKNPGVPGLIVAPSWRIMWSVTYRQIMNILRISLDPDEMPRLRDRYGECYLDFGDGVPIFLRSAKNPESIDGLNVGWALGDELRHWKRNAYEIVLGRIRIPCPLRQAAFASTPAMNWMAEEFDTKKPDRELISAPTKENERNLAPGFIDNLRLSYSSRLQKALIEGEFTVLEGSVFELFDGGHASPWLIDYEPQRDKKTYLWVDPGYRRSAWIFVQHVTPLEWVVFDQIMPDDMSDQACVDRVNAKKYLIDEIWTDPAADNVQSLVGFDTLQALRGVKTRARDPLRTIVDPWRSIAYGVDKVRTMLGGDGLPTRIRFARSLMDYEGSRQRGIVKDLASLRYPDAKDGRPVTDLPLKDGVHDHSCDALRYGVIGLWLTTPKLRELDPVLAREARPGWRMAG